MVDVGVEGFAVQVVGVVIAVIVAIQAIQRPVIVKIRKVFVNGPVTVVIYAVADFFCRRLGATVRQPIRTAHSRARAGAPTV